MIRDDIRHICGENKTEYRIVLTCYCHDCYNGYLDETAKQYLTRG